MAFHGENEIGLYSQNLPRYEPPPAWIPAERRRGHPDYDNDLRQFLPRQVVLSRSRQTDALGFNVRGGAEHACGIYISKIMPGSEAERLGLREADQILMVNDTSFENIDHGEAVKVLKMNLDVYLIVRFFPYGYDKIYEKNKALAASHPPADSPQYYQQR